MVFGFFKKERRFSALFFCFLAFCRCLVFFDSNRLKRSFQLIVIGQKNWLFGGSPEGKETEAVILEALKAVLKSCFLIKSQKIDDYITRFSTFY
ncbi:MAG: hypothetical protein WC371_03450 [Parachlamydiales bacterium]